MVTESNNYRQNFGFGPNSSMFGNNQMNPMNQQVAYNMSQRAPMNLHFQNPGRQIPAIGGSSVNPPAQNFFADPPLFAAPGGHGSAAGYMTNNGLVPAASGNDYPGLFHSSASQNPVAVQPRAYPVPANPGVGAGRAPGNRKAKKRNQRNPGNNIKGHWIPAEDRMLLDLVAKYGSRKWSLIARMMPGRLGKQLRERYNNHLKPGLKKEAWSPEEDMKLIKAHEKIGNKWAQISKLLPGRSESDIKNRWNATKRKCINAISKTHTNPKPSSLFENYVKNMFNRMVLNSSPVSAESTVMTGSSSGGSNYQMAVTDADGSGGVDDGLMDYGLQSSFDPNVLANHGQSSQFESMSYMEMLLQ
ncbi:transcription factor MYB119-like [Daucus carota subsp. sativus]